MAYGILNFSGLRLWDVLTLLASPLRSHISKVVHGVRGRLTKEEMALLIVESIVMFLWVIATPLRLVNEVRYDRKERR